MFGFVRQSTYDAAILESANWQRGAEYWETMYNEALQRGDNLLAKLQEADEGRHGADRAAAMYRRLYEAATKTLGKIAEQETPTANATVKRMARMARAELPLLHHEADHSPSIGMAPQIAAH